MKIAIVGAGIFGVTAATRLASLRHHIDLYEKEGDILMAASGINQYRLHRGYHYPRCHETTISSLTTEESFRQEYSAAIIDDVDHYYCIAKERTLTSGDAYIEFCKKYNLDFTHQKLAIIDDSKIDMVLQVKESLIDPEKLREICWQKLKMANVNVLLNTPATRENLANYDFVVICAYATTNSLLTREVASQRDYQFELCEKPVLRLPKAFAGKSIVIMDGPFMCLDPFGRTDLFVMGNVIHAIHQTNVGKHPVVHDQFKPLLNKGVIKNPPITNIRLFIESAAEFMPLITEAEHMGSMFTIRTVLPNQDATDSRPTLVELIDDKTAIIFSGKISNCVDAATKITRLLDGR